ncbi:MAG: YcxB family protein [Clostridiales bacterium]|nr:YcxB family protein [Clostridiales bacterium]
MEPLFENSFDLNEETMKEFLRSNRKTSLLVFIILDVAVMLFFFLYYLIAYSEIALFYPVAALALIAFSFAMYAVSEKRTLRALREQTDGKPYIVTRRFFGEEFRSSDSISGGEVAVEYEKIAKVVETKNLLILRTNAKLNYILRKDAFTMGTPEEFKSFIEGRIALKKIKR